MPDAFTPGPYRVHPYRDHWIGAPFPSRAIDIGPAGRAVATVIGAFDSPVAGSEAEATARLLAAAPTMLAALRAVITGSTRAIGQDSTGQDVARIRMASLERVREAIALAETLHPVEGIGTPVEGIGTTPTRGNSDV